jgi:hypothetical protein
MRMTDRQKLGRILLVDALSACSAGDCAAYEREQAYYFEEISRSDPEMMFTWARHQEANGNPLEVQRWATRAMERKSAWKGAVYVKRVDALMGMKAKAVYARWGADKHNDNLRNEARDASVAWAAYRGQIGKDTQLAMQMCASAAGSKEPCLARVNDSVATTKVVFVTSPAGARLTVDGKEVGKTPKEVELSFGDHTVAVTSGDRTSSTTIEVGTSKPKRWTWNASENRWTSAY